MSQKGAKQSGAKSGGGSKSRPKGSPKALAGRGGANWRLGAALLALVVLAVGAAYFTQRGKKEGVGTPDVVKIETNKGLIVMEVYPDLVPVTVKNFEGLVKSGFYDGLTWHRVEDWVVQTGDPNGDGTGGSGKTIKLEINRQLRNVRGAVGMARSQHPDSASSQFYILKTDAAWLDGGYAIFGNVIEGMDVVDRLEKGDTMLKVTVEPGTPAK